MEGGGDLADGYPFALFSPHCELPAFPRRAALNFGIAKE
jgi:hypothetical protein